MGERTDLMVLLIEPFFSGSHARWCLDFQKYSSHTLEIIALEGRHWKWRMHGGAISIAEKLKGKMADVIIVSDMIDLPLLKALLPQQLAQVPIVLYMHENQLTYPWSPEDLDVKLKRDRHYGFINYTSALVADRILFNSHYHLESFIGALSGFLSVFPDNKNLSSINKIKAKSSVLYLGIDLNKFNAYFDDLKNEVPVILWNHRWEYDKNPDEFFNSLIELKNEGTPFKLIVLGESYKNSPPIFKEAQSLLSDNIIHWGWVETFEDYAKLLWKADILPVTSNQDFFGGSVVEAIYCGATPLLPNRLTYPEHVELANLYEPGQLTSRLRNLLENRIVFDGTYLSKYDWSELIEDYDRVLSKVRKS
jgi:glycosyltransferase involved in cell wall biosynthesis